MSLSLPHPLLAIHPQQRPRRGYLLREAGSIIEVHHQIRPSNGVPPNLTNKARQAESVLLMRRASPDSADGNDDDDISVSSNFLVSEV